MEQKYLNTQLNLKKTNTILYDNIQKEQKRNNIDYQLSILITKINILINDNYELKNIIKKQTYHINNLYDLIEYNDVNDINEKYNIEI